MNAPQDLSAAELVAFRTMAPADQLRAIRGQRLERIFQVDREAGVDEAARTAYLSIASEQPYERWWGVEILDMGAQSIRTNRLRLGAPLLVGHDTADQVGVVESFEITSDRKLRILARFGRSARAEEIFRDVLDGIRRNASVGYVIHDLVLERQEDGISTYRVTDWEPLEGSLVAVPADPTVGVGRALGEQFSPSLPIARSSHTMPLDQNQQQNESAAPAQAAQPINAARVAEDATRREVDRVSAILAAGDEFADKGGPALARELIKEPLATVETFKARMLERMRGTVIGTATAQPAVVPAYGAAGRQIIRVGQKLRAFKNPIHFTDGSRMEPIEAAYRSGQWLLATVGQNQRAATWCREHGIDTQTRVMTTDVDTAGGYLVPTEMEQSIIDLREAYGLARQLTRRRPMASDTKSVPKRTGGVTAYFINEDNAGVSASDKGWGNVNFVAKTLAALSIISSNLEEDSIIDVVDDLAREMAAAFAQKEDQCWLIGDGTSTYSGMTGLITLFEASALASRATTASGHDTFAEIDNADLTTAMGAVMDMPGLNPVWLSSKTFAHMVFGRLKATAGGATGAELSAAQRNGYLGYDGYTSEIMPHGPTTDYTSKAIALFGDFEKSSSFGDRRGIAVQVLRERYAEKLQVGILGSERFHIVNHDVGSTSDKGPVAAVYGNS